MSNSYFEQEVFNNKKAFIPYIVAGYPSLDETKEYIFKMQEAGADMIELGIPFSDPIAEGPISQYASGVAIENGANLENIFNMVREIREKSNIPLVFMAYANTIYKVGYDYFFKSCDEMNVRGVIIPDVPYEEKDEFDVYARKNNVDLISFVPPSMEDRIKKIAEKSRGFLYVISSIGKDIDNEEKITDLEAITNLIKETTITKTVIGFGIKTTDDAKEIIKHTDGIVVGSAIIKLIDKDRQNAPNLIYDYVKQMKEAINS